MSRTTNARIAGFTFIFYIAAGIAAMNLSGIATGGDGTAARLANLAEHTTEYGIAIILNALCSFSALVLAFTLYAVTREQNRDLALMGFACRVGEGVIGAANLPKSFGLLWLATAGTKAPDAATIQAIGTYLLMPAGSYGISALFFAVGSTVYAYLMLRGRMIPVWLAWLGVIASVILVVVLPLNIGGFVKQGWLEWMPMLVFELVLAVWFIIKGVPEIDRA